MNMHAVDRKLRSKTFQAVHVWRTPPAFTSTAVLRLRKLFLAERLTWRHLQTWMTNFMQKKELIHGGELSSANGMFLCSIPWVPSGGPIMNDFFASWAKVILLPEYSSVKWQSQSNRYSPLSPMEKSFFRSGLNH